MHFRKFFFLIIALHLATPFSSTADIRSQRLGRTAQDLALVYMGAISLYIITLLPLTLCHELGHKYAAKVLTGADSTIEVGFFKGLTKFDKPNAELVSKYPKSKIMALLAGPLAGCLGACGIYFYGSRYFEKYSQLHAISLTALITALVVDLSNLWPEEGNDGAKILKTIKQMQAGNYDKKQTLEKLVDIPTIKKFALLKKIVKDALPITDKTFNTVKDNPAITFPA